MKFNKTRITVRRGLTHVPLHHRELYKIYLKNLLYTSTNFDLEICSYTISGKREEYLFAIELYTFYTYVKEKIVKYCKENNLYIGEILVKLKKDKNRNIYNGIIPKSDYDIYNIFRIMYYLDENWYVDELKDINTQCSYIHFLNVTLSYSDTGFFMKFNNIYDFDSIIRYAFLKGIKYKILVHNDGYFDLKELLLYPSNRRDVYELFIQVVSKGL